MTRILILFLTVLVVVQAEPAVRHTWNTVFPAAVHPEKYADRTVGHFGKKFVGLAKTKMRPNPGTPQRILGKSEPCVVHAALLIGKDGYVKDVAILAQTPEGVVDDRVMTFFKKSVFLREKEGKKSIEYETELILIFQPAVGTKS